MGWKCSHCETLNEATRIVCETCGVPAPERAAWKCANCETSNPGTAEICEVCGADIAAVALITPSPPPAPRSPGTLPTWVSQSPTRKKKVITSVAHLPPADGSERWNPTGIVVVLIVSGVFVLLGAMSYPELIWVGLGVMGVALMMYMAFGNYLREASEMETVSEMRMLKELTQEDSPIVAISDLPNKSFFALTARQKLVWISDNLRIHLRELHLRMRGDMINDINGHFVAGLQISHGKWLITVYSIAGTSLTSWLIAQYPSGRRPVSLCISRNGNCIACFTDDGKLIIWKKGFNLSHQDHRATEIRLDTIDKPVIVFSSEGGYLGLGRDEGLVELRTTSASDLHIIRKWLVGTGEKITALDFSEDSKHLAVGTSGGTFYIIKVLSEVTPGSPLFNAGAVINCIRWDKEGSNIAIVAGAKVFIWSPENQLLSQEFETSMDEVRSLAFLKGGRLVAGGSPGNLELFLNK